MSDTESLEQLLDRKLKPFLSSIEGIRETVKDLVKSTSFLSEKFEEMKNQIENLQGENKTIMEENLNLKVLVADLRYAVDTMEQNLDNMEQYSRRDCLEVKGVPIQDGESTDGIIKTIGENIGVSLEDSDISVSHRLRENKPSRSERSSDPAIIVKFVRRNKRDEFYRARKHLRGKSTKDLGLSRRVESSLYISESLTKRNKDLFYECLRARKELKYNFIWTQAGKIFLRKDARSAAKLITNGRAIEKLYDLEGVDAPPGLRAEPSTNWRARRGRSYPYHSWGAFNDQQQSDE